MASAQPKGKTPPRLLYVKKVQLLSPSLKRITLSGDELAGFPAHSDGDHIKLMFPQSHQKQPCLPTVENGVINWPPAEERPVVRTYSVGVFNPEIQELSVDMVLHGDNGPASKWATRAKIGDAVGLAGPGGPPRVKPKADWFILLADLSSFAALQAALNTLPRNAQGFAFIEADNQKEIIPISSPENMSVTWKLRQGQPARTSQQLLEAVRNIPWFNGTPSIMVAGENAQVVSIRNYLIKEKGLPKSVLYAVPYWKETFNEELYHEERHKIMDEFEETD